MIKLRVLVTGGLGFIGSNFIQKLLIENEDYEIQREEQFCETCRQDDSRIKDASRKLFGRLSQREKEAAHTWISMYFHLVGEEENDC